MKGYTNAALSITKGCNPEALWICNITAKWTSAHTPYKTDLRLSQDQRGRFCGVSTSRKNTLLYLDYQTHFKTFGSKYFL